MVLVRPRVPAETLTPGLLSAGSDAVIKLADVETGRVRSKHPKAHADGVNAVEFLGPQLYASGDDGGVVKVWDVRSSDAVFESDLHFDYISNIHAHDTRTFIVTSGDGSLSQWDTRKLGKQPPAQSQDQEEDLMDSAVVAGQQRLAVGQLDGVVSFFRYGKWTDNVDRVLPPVADVGVDALLALGDAASGARGAADELIVAFSDASLWRLSVLPNRYTQLLGRYPSAGTVAGLCVSHDSQSVISASGSEVTWHSLSESPAPTSSTDKAEAATEAESGSDSDSDAPKRLSRKEKKRRRKRERQQANPPKKSITTFAGME